MLVNDLRALTTTAVSAAADQRTQISTRKAAASTAAYKASLNFDTKHKVLICLLKIQLSANFSDIIDSL